MIRSWDRRDTTIESQQMRWWQSLCVLQLRAAWLGCAWAQALCWMLPGVPGLCKPVSFQCQRRSRKRA